MKIELEVPEELAKQFGEEALKTYLQFKIENMTQKMLTNFSSSSLDSDLSEEQNMKLNEAWEKIKRMGPSC